MPEFNEEVRQVVEIDADGTCKVRRYVQGWGFQRDVLAWKETFSIPKDAARSLLDRLYAYFSDNPIIADATDIGFFTIVIDCGDGSRIRYRMSICLAIPTPEGDLGHLIRAALNRDFLYLFDCGAHEPCYRYVLVSFQRGGKTYWYQTDKDLSLHPGDHVRVPVGEKRTLKTAVVEEVHTFSDADVPMDPHRVRFIEGILPENKNPDQG